NLISPGGRLMVEYGVTEETHASTARALQFGIPPAVTPLGYLLWRSGFRAFKDWYFAEGWREGETKLQGDKPLNLDQERRMTEKTAEELERFLNQELREDLKEWEEPAREVAKKILKELR
ncbi:MAG: DUF1122 family protein, partial [Actinomycetota bacterium]